VYPYRLCRPGFENAYALLTPRQRGYVKRLVAEVCRDPAPDDNRTIRLPYLGAMYVKAIDDDGYWLLYYEQDGTIYCVSCSHESPFIDPVVDIVDADPPA
jgi:hypothetical protein